jgi:hypothetical protein
MVVGPNAAVTAKARQRVMRRTDLVGRGAPAAAVRTVGSALKLPGMEMAAMPIR